MAGWGNIGALAPREISYDQMTGVNGRLYTVGGYGSNGLSTRYTQVYDISANRWSGGGSLVEPRSFFGLTCSESELYVAGGEETYLQTSTQSYVRTLNSVEAYNISAGSWRLLGHLQSARFRASAAYCNGIVYVFGGEYYNQSTNDHYFLDSIEAISVHTGQSSIVARLKRNRSLHASVAIGTKVYIVGGYGDSGDISALEIFDTETLSITEGAPSPITEQCFATVFEGKIYALSELANEVFSYDPIENKWKHEVSVPWPSVRSFKDIAAVGYTLYGKTEYVSIDPIVTYDLRTATLSNLSPTAGFVNEQEDQKFSWFFDSQVRQTSATFQWRITSTSTVYSIHVAGNQQYVVIPANTFPDGSIDWRISATGEEGIDADWTPWHTLTTIDEPPTKPTGLYPGSGMRDGTKSIQLSWIHNSPLSTPQGAYEVEVTYDGGATWHTVGGKVTTSETLHIVPAGSLEPDTTGRVGWRVRTYNSDDAASPWSDAAYFIVLFAPDAPEWRSVESGKSRPLCEWVAPGQIAYQMQITQGESVVYDTGETYGPATQHRVTEYLKNGTYTFRLRYKNQLNIWSDYADRSVSINARGRLKLSLNGEKIPNGARLTFTVEVV